MKTTTKEYEATEMTSIAQAHQKYFGEAPLIEASAPGRVNLLGEHTDYNGGYVLPIALKDLGVDVAVSCGHTPGIIEARSETFDSAVVRNINEEKSGQWSDYILGCAGIVARGAVAESGLRLTLKTTVPLGAGLSSSAALEVSTMRALNQLFNLNMNAVDIAVAARRVENEFVGVPCGIMDQFASSVGEKGQALFLNTRTLEYSAAPNLPEHAFVVVDSGVHHQLNDGGYASRVEQCRAAGAALGVEFLSDLTEKDLARSDALHEPLNRRVRHIVTDNRLALAGHAALKAGDAAQFGQLMIESHATARDNYGITVPETDALASNAVSAGALGARQTGGGWGGAVVSLVPTNILDRWCKDIIESHKKTRVLAIT